MATRPENLVFAAALALMLLIGAAEALGLSGVVELDADGHWADGHAGDWLGWLGLGRVPLSVLLVLFLAAFGLVGLAGQQLLGPVSAWVAGPAAAAAALPVAGLAARVLGPLIPRGESTAVELDELVGRQALVVTGTAARGSPARARSVDRHGQPHFVMVEPDGPETFREGDAVLLVRREDHLFRAVGRGDAHLPRLDY